MSDPALVIPAGRNKGVPISQASQDDCQYWADRIAGELASGEARYPQRAEKQLSALRARLAVLAGMPSANKTARRHNPRPRTATQPGAQQAPSNFQASALAIRSPETLASMQGTFSRRDQVLAVLGEAARTTHLITPQTACGDLPAGFALSTSLVWVDPQNETYAIPKSSKRGLSKVALDKLAAAAGIDWNPVLSRRLDDASDPHYVHFQAVATVRNFDGTPRTIAKSKELDLREGSQASLSMTPGEIAQQRRCAYEMAESKAMNRVIRTLGVQTSYSPSELEKPFCVVKLAWTGQTDDVELRRMLAAKAFDAFHGGTQAMYSQPAPSLPRGHMPPPLAAGYGDHADDPDDNDFGQHAGAQASATFVDQDRSYLDADYDDGAYEEEGGDDADNTSAEDDAYDDAADGAPAAAAAASMATPSTNPAIAAVQAAAAAAQGKRPSNRPPAQTELKT